MYLKYLILYLKLYILLDVNNLFVTVMVNYEVNNIVLCSPIVGAYITLVLKLIFIF